MNVGPILEGFSLAPLCRTGRLGTAVRRSSRIPRRNAQARDGAVCLLGRRNRESIAVPLLRARIPGGPLRNADIACGNPERTVGAWRQHPTTVAGLYACATHGEPYLHRSRRQQGGLRAI